MADPADHPLRAQLTHEVHARPFETLDAPLVADRLVFLVDPNGRERDIAHLSALARAHGATPPEAHVNHFSLSAGAVRVRWERHTEFVSYTFFRALGGASESPDLLVRQFDPDWVANMPGRRLSVQRVWVAVENPGETLSRARGRLDVDSLVGAALTTGQFRVLTDFRMGHDAAVHYLVGVDRDYSPRRLGRHVQRLLEIETYRMMALLGLPQARQAGAALAESEREVAALTESIRAAGPTDEGRLLESVTDRAADVEALYAVNHSRLSASAAYFALVDARLAELRQQPLAELQTLSEFLQRRLSPARDTCEATARRLESLSRRVMQVSALLRTRVELEQLGSQNALLETMTRRQALQLRLQSTVEGLSVVAITYYGASLVSLLAKGIAKLGWPVGPELSGAISVPVIAVGAWLLVRRVHHKLNRSI